MHAHRHEMVTGVTSSISHHVLGFSKGCVINHVSQYTYEQIVLSSEKVVILTDTPGGTKYMKTTIQGILTNPHGACLVVAANANVSQMTKDLYGIIVYLGMPCCVLVTKLDVAHPTQLERTIRQLLGLIDSSKKQTIVVQSIENIKASAQSTDLVPLVLTSSVTGDNISLLTMYLESLPEPIEIKGPLIFQIERVYRLPHGRVVSGVVRQGTLETTSDATFYVCKTRIQIACVKRLRLTVRTVKSGQSCTLLLNMPDLPIDIKKGMCIVSAECAPITSFEMSAKMLSGKLAPGSCGRILPTNQAVRVVSSNFENGIGTVSFRFVGGTHAFAYESEPLYFYGAGRCIGRITSIW